MMCTKNSPCAVCRRVAMPEQCDNKDCMLWRRWFIARWDQLRARYLPRQQEQNSREETP